MTRFTRSIVAIVSVLRRTVGLLTLKMFTPWTYSHACSEPAGRPLYTVP